jgi:hypothetical protein
MGYRWGILSMNQDGDFKGLDLTNRNEEHKFGAPNASNEWFKIETGIVLIFQVNRNCCGLHVPTRSFDKPTLPFQVSKMRS